MNKSKKDNLICICEIYIYLFIMNNSSYHLSFKCGIFYICNNNVQSWMQKKKIIIFNGGKCLMVESAYLFA